MLGTEFYRGVGTIMLFGLMIATLLTLTLLPTLLVTVLRLGERPGPPRLVSWGARG